MHALAGREAERDELEDRGQLALEAGGPLPRCPGEGVIGCGEPDPGTDDRRRDDRELGRGSGRPRQHRDPAACHRTGDGPAQLPEPLRIDAPCEACASQPDRGAVRRAEDRAERALEALEQRRREHPEHRHGIRRDALVQAPRLGRDVEQERRDPGREPRPGEGGQAARDAPEAETDPDAARDREREARFEAHRNHLRSSGSLPMATMARYAASVTTAAQAMSRPPAAVP